MLSIKTNKKPHTQAGDDSPPAFGGGDIGIHLIVCVLMGGGAGYALDRWLGCAPWGLLAGGFAGFGAWLMAVWRILNQKKN